jgi:uncharacterized protein YodC (DUF2158 family)
MAEPESDSTEFQPGDIVQLKSGGPRMTVEHFDPGSGNEYECQWFDGGALQSGFFPAASLVKIENNTQAI